MAFPKSRFQVTKVNIEISKPLECMFALVKPLNQTARIKKLIAVCFYSPPKSKQNTKLIDLITVEISRLRTQYKGCGVIICGHRNDMKVDQLLTGDPALRQVACQPTNKNQDKVVDMILRDLHAGYQEPTIPFMVQPMPDSLIAEFGRRQLQEDWRCLEDGMSADQLVDTFQAAAGRMVDETFPMKKVPVIQGS